MNSCATCTHWTEIELDPPAPDYQEHPYPTIHDALPVDHGTRWGECGAMDLDRQRSYTEPERRLAYAQDGSNYSASLRTQDRFGCVMWEKTP